MSSITRGRPWQALLLLFAGTGCAAALNSSPVLRTGGPAKINLPADKTPADFSRIRADLTQGLANGLFDEGPLRVSTRESCAGCPPVQVEIQAIGQTTDIDPAKPLPALRVIGRVKNRGNNDEHNYGLQRGLEYLIFLTPMPGGTVGANLWLFELPAGGTGTATWKLLGAIQVCHSYTNPNPSSDTDFRDYSECDTPIYPRGYEMRAEKPIPGPNAPFSPDGHTSKHQTAVFTLTSGIWFECTPGCCVGR